MNFRKLKCKLGLHDIEIYYLKNKKLGYEYACPNCGISQYVNSRVICIRPYKELVELRKNNNVS